MNTLNTILFRVSIDTEEEYAIAKKYFHIETTRSRCSWSLVIPRYSSLPYYRELEIDLSNNCSYPINSYEQHAWIADFSYYEYLTNFTPKTYTDNNFYTAPEDCYVVKGKTNSKKMQWNRLMFANNKRQALEIAGELMSDSAIASQGIIYRQYVPLKTFEVGINGLPFTNEWRFFFFREQMLSYGYYWSLAENASSYKCSEKCIEVAHQIAKIAAQHTNFFVLDMAETAAGQWILIEMNCGTMSGLSENDPDVLYSNLKKILE